MYSLDDSTARKKQAPRGAVTFTAKYASVEFLWSWREGDIPWQTWFRVGSVPSRRIPFFTETSLIITEDKRVFWDHVDSELFLSRSCLGNGEQQLSNITADKPCINGLSLKYSSSSQGSWFWKTRRWSLNIYEICRYYHYIRQIQGRGWLRTVITPPQVRRKANQYINSVYLLYTPVEAKLVHSLSTGATVGYDYTLR